LTFTQRTIEVVLPQKPEKFSHRNTPVTGTIGSLIVTARRAAGLTQKQLAVKAGMLRRWLGRWERGTALPNEDEWTKLRKILELPESIAAL
jgi:ribosome-binding protein aMBF1 (putative translation factor)